MIFGSKASTQKPRRTVALAGNPNVGKSTLFNALTGMHQHTGNWPGKTVENAVGFCESTEFLYTFVDIPGTYSLMAHSAEEEIARDYLCFGDADLTVIVCDATCLERNMNLVLQTLEVCTRAVVCVNLLDEAARKHIVPDLALLSARLGVRVVGTIARKKKTIRALLAAIDCEMHAPPSLGRAPVRYPDAIERALADLTPRLTEAGVAPRLARFLALHSLGEKNGLTDAAHRLGILSEEEGVRCAQDRYRRALFDAGLSGEVLTDAIVGAIVDRAGEIVRDAVRVQERDVLQTFDRRMDRFLTGRLTAIPVMLLLLCAVFWITVSGANYPSAWLSSALFYLQDRLTELFVALGAPAWLHGVLVLGLYRVLAWVISVMLPPMAIFFPLFSLLEDSGYLPRVAYNLDRPFRRCNACGKQALTMCMGFGCNAVGVTGCRIIDSPRERYLAIVTNSFVPCNGRFPTILSLLTIFTVGVGGSSLLSALLLTGVILLGVGMTFLATAILSRTLLRGEPSAFTLELPPYRRPDVGRVLVRSMLDRTLFVLGRAVAVAAPAGVLIWLLANLEVGGASGLSHIAAFLDPLGRLMGMDGVILMAFLLGFPANEIVVPILLMTYMATGTLTDLSDLTSLREVLVANGWSTMTAVCTVLFSLFHFPCSTTVLTIASETRSAKYTLLSVLLPTVVGFLLCTITALLFRMLA